MTKRSPILVLVVLTWLGASAMASAHAGQAATLTDGATAEVVILETTDIHAHVLGYDYYAGKPDPTQGLARTATLIRQARKRYPNTLLFDAGDTIQGTALADYQALVKPIDCGRELAVYKAMDAIGYDAGTIGNHGFNYGLAFLAQVTGTPMHVRGVPPKHCAGPHFPLVLSNVFSTLDGKPIFAPWRVITRTIEATAADGRPVRTPLRIGVLGFTPPPVMQWDKQHLYGKVRVMGVVEAANKYLPELKKQHPDLIVALVHGGLSTDAYSPRMENAGWYLARVPGIDVLLLGHAHTTFPGPRFQHMPGVDNTRGTVHGVPAVMAGMFGKDLGLIHLQLRRVHGRWVSLRTQARSTVQPICSASGQCVAADPGIAPLVATAHKATIAYVNTPIGLSDMRMSSYFADLGDVSALAVVNAAQRDYVKHWIATTRPELKDIPVLSAAAAFRTGAGGAGDYTDVAPGALTLRDAASLYVYPNTVAAVHIDGAGLKAWLEKSAERFNRIDPTRRTPQPLINPAFPGFNFDQIQGGIQYRIDVSQPAGKRIVSLTWHGKPVRPRQAFIVATNNYRASGGGHFPNLDGQHVLLSTTDASRDVLVAWLRRHPRLRRADLPPRSWQFVPLTLRGPVTLVSASGKLGVAHADGIDRLRLLRVKNNGTSTYAIDW